MYRFVRPFMKIVFSTFFIVSSMEVRVKRQPVSFLPASISAVAGCVCVCVFVSRSFDHLSRLFTSCLPFQFLVGLSQKYAQHFIDAPHETEFTNVSMAMQATCTIDIDGVQHVKRELGYRCVRVQKLTYAN